jgi:hypothetical protein
MRRADRAPVSRRKVHKPSRAGIATGAFRPPPKNPVDKTAAWQAAIEVTLNQVQADGKTFARELAKRIDDLEAWRSRQGATMKGEQPESDVLKKLKGLMNRTADDFGMIAEIPEEWQQYAGYTFDAAGTCQQLYELGIRRGIEAAILYVSSET